MKSIKCDFKVLDLNMDFLGKLFDLVNFEIKVQKKIMNENCKDIEVYKNFQILICRLLKKLVLVFKIL